MTQYSFSDLGFPSQELEALEQLQAIKRSSQEHLSSVFEAPEFGFALDLASRSSSESRQFKHVHQMCQTHAIHFEKANQIKTTYILDSYLWAAAQLNPVAVYSAARSLLELHAVLRYFEHRLSEACTGAEAEWRERGHRYFDLILRARYGTSDPKAQRILKMVGIPETALKPIRVGKARAFLTNELPWIDEHYALLCDFVHHNMSSQRTAGSLVGKSHMARSSAGGGFLMAQQHPIVQYTFPAPDRGRHAVRDTATRALENVRGVMDATNRFPRSPFTEAELMAKTGSAIGFKPPSRNARCPCGSGKKYRNCHGAALA